MLHTTPLPTHLQARNLTLDRICLLGSIMHLQNTKAVIIYSFIHLLKKSLSNANCAPGKLIRFLPYNLAQGEKCNRTSAQIIYMNRNLK